MTLRELELFYHLCENPHVSQLSKDISISQSAISLAIKSLESKLKEPLFDRLGKKLVLNERGRLFKEQTYKHFLALKDIQKQFQEEKLWGVLKISASKTTGNYLLPHLIFSFIENNPAIKIEREIKNSTQIVEIVLEGKADIGLIETECHHPKIAKQFITSDELVIVSSNKKLANKSFYIDQLTDMKWLFRESGSGTRELFLKALGELAKDITIFMEYTEFEEMKNLLDSHKETITCISKFVVKKELQRGELFEIKLKNISLDRKLYLIYHKDKYKSNLFQSFVDFVTKYNESINIYKRDENENKSLL